ncbi:MAG: iron complex outermembrane receptor protein [Zhongshania aliphaticivorans]|jgi:iron complex outermembrane receptor protein
MSSQLHADENPEKKKGSRNRLLEEVVVTAQKREEDSQDVPIAISASSGEKLEAFGIQTTADLQKITPGLTFTYSFGYTVIYLRGVGSDAFLPSADPSIATYIDGINIPPSRGKNDSLGPLKRIEVLKGPQGTLFGRNATGGAINIVTADPPINGESFVGNVRADIGNYGREKYQLYAASNIAGGFGATVAMFDNSGDMLLPNYIKNVEGDEVRGPGREDMDEGFRVKLKWDISDTLSAGFIASYVNQFNGSSLAMENTRPSPLAGGDGSEIRPDRRIENNHEGGNAILNFIYGANLDWSLGPLDVKFTASSIETDVDWGQWDLDATQSNQASFNVYSEPSLQETFEVQLTSNQDTWMSDKLEWVAGVYHLTASSGFDRFFLTANTGLVTPLITGRAPDSLQDSIVALLSELTANNDVTLESTGIMDTTSDSVYFQGTWEFDERFNLTLGARYQKELREMSATYVDVIRTVPTTPPQEYYEGNDRSRNTRIFSYDAQETDYESVSWRIASQYFASDQVQFYTSLSKSFKSPTYNVINFFSAADSVKAEEVTSFELGVKSEMWDGQLRLNGAIFKSVTQDFVTAIVSLTSGGVVRFSNADEAVAQGAEVDLQWQPMPDWNPGLAINASSTYLDAKYTDYQNGSGFDDDTGLYFGQDSATNTPVQAPRDFSENAIVRTPRLSSNISLNQFIDFGNYGSLELAVDYAYKSSYNVTPQASPYFIQDQFEVWGARTTWFYDPLGIQVTAYVDNAKDKDYYSSILQIDFGRTAALANPRFYGVRLKWDYGMMFE